MTDETGAMSGARGAMGPHAACHECDLPYRMPPRLPRGASAYCRRCGALLCRARPDPWRVTLPLALAGLPLFPVLALLPFLTVNISGRSTETRLLGGPAALEQAGMPGLAFLVLATSFLVPLLQTGCLAGTLIGLCRPRPPRVVRSLFRIYGHLGHWAMVEVFLLGVIVAFTKLAGMARVEIGLAGYALVALMLLMAAVNASLDREAVWRRMQACGLGGAPTRGPPSARSIQRGWALLIAAAILYVPANIYPVMVITSLGSQSQHTILQGVVEFVASNDWPLAILVFFASVVVPCLKLAGLAYLLVATGRGSGHRLRDRARLYRIIEFVGRWSMIDVFLVAVLASLVNMGAIVSIGPGFGVVAFAAVVVLTIIAALTFDPRLMWQAAKDRAP